MVGYHDTVDGVDQSLSKLGLELVPEPEPLPGPEPESGTGVLPKPVLEGDPSLVAFDPDELGFLSPSEQGMKVGTGQET